MKTLYSLNIRLGLQEDILVPDGEDPYEFFKKHEQLFIEGIVKVAIKKDSYWIEELDIQEK
jgi:hypothetical protein